MRKFFTLATALLASFGLWATAPDALSFNEPTELPEGYVYSSTNTPSIVTIDGKSCVYVSNGGGGSVVADCFTEEGLDASKGKRWMGFEIDADSKVVLNVYSNKKKFTLYNASAAEEASFTNAGKAWEDWTIENLPAGKYILSAASSQCYVSAITFGEGAAPSTDPVSVVNIEGPTEGFIGVPVTFTLTTDVKANAIKWFVDGAEQEGENNATFKFTPVAERTYRVLAEAKNDYNADFVVSNFIDLAATEKPAAVPCAELYPAATGDTPAEGGKVALNEASYGGNIIFAGAKEGKYESAFKYTNYGLQMCTGSADSARVELGFQLKEGSIIKLLVNVRGLADGKVRGFNLLAPGQKKVLEATWKAVEQAGDTIWEKEFEYEVKAGDGLAGQNKFDLQRSNSAILQGIIVSDCGEEILPDTRPVMSVAIQGPAEGFVGQKVLLKAVIEAEPDEIVWRDGYNGHMLATNVKSYELELTEAGLAQVYVEARNQYNAEGEWIESERFSINVTEQLEQLPVSGNVVWDWANAAESEIKLTDKTTPKKNERCLLANVAGINNNEEFNSQALLFEGEYPFRVQGDFKLCQGQLLQFIASVPGFVTIEYSNTGNRTPKEGEIEGEEAERRFLTINGARVDGDLGSMKSNEKLEVANIPVVPGDVAISGVMPFRTDGKDAAKVEYLRIYKVQFTIEKVIPQAIDNTEAGVKAVKFFRDGQLMIEKNGILYNAQGKIVK